MNIRIKNSVIETTIPDREPEWTILISNMDIITISNIIDFDLRTITSMIIISLSKNEKPIDRKIIAKHDQWFLYVNVE